MKQRHFRAPCSWPVETLPYWHHYNKYNAVNRHRHQVLFHWCHTSSSYCFMKDLNCIVYLKSWKSRAEWIQFELFWAISAKCRPPLNSNFSLLRPSKQYNEIIITGVLREAPTRLSTMGTDIIFCFPRVLIMTATTLLNTSLRNVNLG